MSDSTKKTLLTHTIIKFQGRGQHYSKNRQPSADNGVCAIRTKDATEQI